MGMPSVVSVWIASLIIPITIAGCAPHAASTSPAYDPPSTSNPKNAVYTTLVSFAGCPIKGLEGAPVVLALAGSLAAAAVGPVMDYLGNAASKAAEDQTHFAFTSRSVELRDTLPPCITVARGWFFASIPPDYSKPGEKREFNNLVDRNIWASRVMDSDVDDWYRVGLYPAQPPDFYFIGALRRSADGTMYRISAARMGFHRPLESAALRNDAGRHIALVFGFNTDKKKLLGDGKKVPDALDSGGTVIQLPYLPVGTTLSFEPNTCTSLTEPSTGGAVRTCKAYKDGLTNVEPGGQQYEPFGNWFTMPTLRANMPLVVQVAVFETVEGSKAAALVASLVKSPAVQGAVASGVKALTPEKQ